MTPPAAAHGEEGAGAKMSGAVCCMCGDQGLADELFRCRCCRARLQHRYCSDLYPRAAAYRRCNWCLRAPAPDQQGGRAASGASVAAGDNNRLPEDKRKTTASASDEERRHQRHEAGCSRSPPFSELGGHSPAKKKHRAAEEKTPQPAALAAGKKEVVSAGAAAGRSKDDAEVMRAGTKARVNRVRPRRYKLLTEVISC